MTRAKLAAAGIVVVLTTVSGSASAARQYACNGEKIVPTGEPTPPITANLRLGPPLTVIVDGKKLDARILRHNRVQLRFDTSEFVGEFFYYTAELILIYDKLGHLAKLPCSES
jgi:hypothetical protein